ncbi:site-specific integrase [Niveispirillum cyanobacteriorum]|uniref:Integrase n=1 Tax=Niveispirillum cyanobacteriorum TaxID=1612173 RepID=A0A2K9N8P2_9PROT|nr:site-specific integrase [Niveispirillum cyanobacteriorum]AUN29467.1 integrase [Niveispirillum cyanobacteriorum]GGE63874.1 integrase [Niveispirillum cyanobacteriorum]
MNSHVSVKPLADLPSSIRSRDGAEVCLDGDVWYVTGPSAAYQFSFRRLREFASDELVASAKAVIVHYMERHSLAHANNIMDRFVAFIRFAGKAVPLQKITAPDVLSYRATLASNTEWYLGTLRGFFRSWVDLRLAGLDPEVIKVLDKVRLKGNRKGDAVRTADPEKGPFTEMELQAIVTALNDAFAHDEIDIADYVLVQLFLALGARAIQLATLKISDFSVTQASSGERAYLIQLPRAKQRGKEPRAEFKPRRLSGDLGRLVEAHCEATKRVWVNLGIPLDQLPFWPNPENVNTSEGLLHHSTATDLNNRVQSVFDVLKVVSERTGFSLIVSTRRFRYTLGTRAAREGLSELVIAEILDHSDTQNVGVYVEAVPEIVERIDRAMAMELAPMAQAFVGLLIDGEDQAERADDPRSRIVTPGDLKHPVGSCGSYGFCGAMAPIACYTCRNFQPWLDGPHEQVLEQLLADRQRIMVQTGDATIAAINDRVIYACAEVVRLCQERMGEAAE